MKFFPSVVQRAHLNWSEPDWVSVPASDRRAGRLFKPHHFALNDNDTDLEVGRAGPCKLQATKMEVMCARRTIALACKCTDMPHA